MTIRHAGAGAKPAPLFTLLQRLVLAAAFGAVAPLTTASAQVVDPVSYTHLTLPTTPYV